MLLAWEAAEERRVGPVYGSFLTLPADEVVGERRVLPGYGFSALMAAEAVEERRVGPEYGSGDFGSALTLRAAGSDFLGEGVTDILGGSQMGRGAPFAFRAIARRLFGLTPAALDSAFSSREARRADFERPMVVAG